jgi:hypothetical protein
MKVFGIGRLFSVPTSNGSAPVEFGILQDVSIDMSFEKKDLHGRLQFPVAVARGKGKIEMKAKFAEIRSNAFNQVLQGTITTGMRKIIEPVSATIPATAPFTVTITAPTSATVTADMGVYDVSNASVSVPMTLVSAVTTATASDSYAFVTTTGVYTFTSADAGKAIQYSYEYSIPTGTTLAVTNVRMGSSPVFAVELYTSQVGTNQPGQLALKFNQATSTKLSFTIKNDDYVIPDFDISAFADSAGNVLTIYSDE